MSAISQVQPGDVIFYSPKGIAKYSALDPTQFLGTFTLVAAYAQGYPYVYSQLDAVAAAAAAASEDPEFFKPWFHVAVVTEVKDDGSPSKVTGFHEGMAEEPFGTRVTEIPFETKRAWMVLRGSDGESVANAAKDLIDTEYNVAGLLAFALATKARMLPESTARTTLLKAAYGANALAQKNSTDECCVSVVVAALGANLTFVEPPAPQARPGQAEGAGEYELAPELADIDKMLQIILASEESEAEEADLKRRRPRLIEARLALGGHGLTDDFINELGDVIGVPHLQTAEEYDVWEAPEEPVPEWFVSRLIGFGDLDSLAAYLELLRKAIDGFAEGGIGFDELILEGEKCWPENGGQPTPTGLIVSPAMLFDAMKVGGFYDPNE